ncbi:MAG: PA0069 family radical SAM protein [Pseudomonadota bacterium]
MTRAAPPSPSPRRRQSEASTNDPARRSPAEEDQKAGLSSQWDRPSPMNGGKGERGRGARSNQSGRYEPETREAVDDGWEASAWEVDADDAKAENRTRITIERPRKIINYVESPFVRFDRSINLYRGCEHGCIYCFARPTHAYHGLSPGLDFEREIFVKPNAARLLERELSAQSYRPAPIAIGTNTDPYQPTERQYRLMRAVLTVLTRFNHAVSILTKSAMIMRDIDLLAPMAEAGLVRAMFSITTLNPRLARAMEPRASSPARRLAAVTALARAGVPVGVMTAPMIPGLNDHELEALIAAAKDAGAQFAGYTIIRLPQEVSGLFREWIKAAFPHRAEKVMRIVREMNGGRDYDPEWSRAERPRALRARLIDQRFRLACRRVDLSTDIPPLNTQAFRAAAFRRPVENQAQLSLFDESKG